MISEKVCFVDLNLHSMQICKPDMYKKLLLKQKFRVFCKTGNNIFHCILHNLYVILNQLLAHLTVLKYKDFDCTLNSVELIELLRYSITFIIACNGINSNILKDLLAATELDTCGTKSR